jgi:5'-nucleotidase
LLVLLTNDDGVNARGLLALKEELSRSFQVWVVAPDSEQSATSHSLTLQRPLRINKIADRFYSVDGTPTDAVMLGVHAILKKKPDILVSGINHGPNMGDDVSYSGTVAAAMEGTILNIPSIAVSNVKWNPRHLEPGAKFVSRLAKFVLKHGLPEYIYLNVNVPDRKQPIRKFKITRLGKRRYSDVVIEKIDPRGRNYYWIGEQSLIWERKDEDTDFAAIKKGYVSITPLHLDMTDYRALEQIKKWKLL